MSAQINSVDVFISHSSQDNEVVDRIVDKLRNLNLKLWYDREQILGGHQFIRKIEEGLENSRIVIAFLSRASISSYWAKMEWDAMLGLTAKDPTRRLIPIMLPGIQDSDVPPLLRVLNYLDFRNSDLNMPDQFNDCVDKLVQHITGKLKPGGGETLKIPFVVFAMNKKEAAALATGEVFKSADATPNDKALFERLIPHLDYGVDEIPDFYEAAREDWLPPLSNPRGSQGRTTVRSTIDEIIDRINDSARGTIRIRPQFLSDDFFSEQDDWRWKTWSLLQDIGCVLVIDALSLFHPILRENLKSSGLSTHRADNVKVSIVVLSPRRCGTLSINDFLESDVKQMLQIAFDRWSNNLDMLCEYGIGNERALRRWLFWSLPETAKAVQGKKANPNSKKAVGDIFDNQGIGPSQGMGSVISKR